MNKVAHCSHTDVLHFFCELHYIFLLYVLSKALLKWAFQGWCQAQNTVTSVSCDTITLSVLAKALCCTEDLQDSTKPWNTHAFLRHQLPRYLQQQFMQFHWWEQEARLCLAPIRFNGSTAQWWGRGDSRQTHPVLHSTVLWQKPARRKKPTVKDNTTFSSTSGEWCKEETNERP